LDHLVVTHPFHPLAGQQLNILFQRHLKRSGLIYFCDAGARGDVVIPASFTDRGAPPGDRPLTREILAEFAALMKKLTTNLDSKG
jgi:hypothetical protein